MPVYQYHCADCGLFERLRPLSLSHEGSACPCCDKASERTIGSAPFLASSSRNSIAVAGLNEKAQHEPKRSSQQEKKHRAGCSCCSGSSTRISNKTLKNSAGDKMFPGKRPWMISH